MTSVPESAQPPHMPVQIRALYVTEALLVQILAYGVLFVGGIFLFVYAEMAGLGSDYVETPEGEAIVLLLSFVVMSIGTTLLIAFFARRRRLTLSDLGLGKARRVHFALAAACFVAIFVVVMLLEQLLGPEDLAAMEEMTRSLVPTQGVPVYVSALFVIFLIPFTEELFFRGVLIRTLERHMPTWGAATLTALIFTAFHFHYFSLPGIGGYVGMLEILALSVALTVPYLVSGSIWPSVLLHGCWNSIAVLSTVA